MRTHTKLFAALTACALLIGGLAQAAGADEVSNDSSPGFSVNAGTGPRFDLDAPGGAYPTVGAFADVTLNGNPQLTSAQIAPFTVIDDSGSAAGWNVTLLIPSFKDGTDADCNTAPTNTLAATTVSTGAPAVAAGTSDTSMTGVSGAGFSNFTSAKKIVVATATHGAGTYLISPAIVKYVVPANAIAGDYCSLATIAIASGP